MPAIYTDYDCPKCGNSVYDNTVDKRNPRAPDHKCSNQNCDYVKWPPRGGGQRNNAPVPSRRSAPPPPQRQSQDDRSSRIERQHSQEMALRYLAMRPNQETQVTKVTLRQLISWFQRDIGHSPEKTEPEMVEPGQVDISDDEPF